MFLQMPEQTAGNEPRMTDKRLLEAKLPSVRIRIISCDSSKARRVINLAQWIMLSYLMFGNIFWTIAVFKICLEDFFFKFGKKINFPKNSNFIYDLSMTPIALKGLLGSSKWKFRINQTEIMNFEKLSSAPPNSKINFCKQ